MFKVYYDQKVTSLWRREQYFAIKAKVPVEPLEAARVRLFLWELGLHCEQVIQPPYQMFLSHLGEDSCTFSLPMRGSVFVPSNLLPWAPYSIAMMGNAATLSDDLYSPSRRFLQIWVVRLRGNFGPVPSLLPEDLSQIGSGPIDLTPMGQWCNQPIIFMFFT